MERNRGKSGWQVAALLLGVAALALLAPRAAARPPFPTGNLDRYASGEVFFFSTTDLMVAYSATSGNWYPLSLEGQEMIRASDFAGRVIVVATTKRILGFSSLTNQWAFVPAIPNEEVLQVFARDKVGVVRTSLRSLGFSALTGDWGQLDLRYEPGGGYN